MKSVVYLSFLVLMAAAVGCADTDAPEGAMDADAGTGATVPRGTEFEEETSFRDETPTPEPEPQPVTVEPESGTADAQPVDHAPEQSADRAEQQPVDAAEQSSNAGNDSDPSEIATDNPAVDEEPVKKVPEKLKDDKKGT
ncbi:MAG: hypothetical protein DWQ37_11360 [Planctomycetota bacterium]|nr:MAG: hypothetical protein DWQ37_11360 [Planctomycetota bacterium]